MGLYLWFGLEPGGRFQPSLGSLHHSMRACGEGYLTVFGFDLRGFPRPTSRRVSANPNYLYLQSGLNVRLSPESGGIADMAALRICAKGRHSLTMTPP